MNNKVSTNLKLQVKDCVVCGREFHNRKSWNSRGMWEEIKYCSNACSKMKNNLEYKAKFTKDVKKRIK